MHYTHAEVPGSSDTSGDSGGRRPRRRSEIQYVTLQLERKHFTEKHFFSSGIACTVTKH